MTTNSNLRRTTSDTHDPPPPIQAQFFYASPVPIDDPLSPIPPPSSTPYASHSQPPKPFSEHDNAALESSWLELSRRIHERLAKRDSEQGGKTRSGNGFSERQNTSNSYNARQGPSNRRHDDSGSSWEAGASRLPSASSNRYIIDHSTQSTLPSSSPLDEELMNKPRSKDLNFLQFNEAIARTEVDSDSESAPQGLTGTPFIRAPSRSKLPTKAKKEMLTDSGLPLDQALHSDNYTGVYADEEDDRMKKSQDLYPDIQMKVPVGMSRLHQVAMPRLQMEPIYWSPVGDIANVIRATWFYKDSMLPVEVDIANLLEANYLVVRPWTQTWQDELNSAVQVGADGEMKISVSLWPDKTTVVSNDRPGSATSRNSGQLVDETPETLRKQVMRTVCEHVDLLTKSTTGEYKAAGTSNYGRDGRLRHYSESSVIYANEKEAYLLRPSLQPSSYYGRRPLANYIRKNHKIGICVVRGFDRASWAQLYPTKGSIKAARAYDGTSASQAMHSGARRDDADPWLLLSSKPVVTDLVLVIHGIGQKLSERVESFHFTHSMNAFRRSVNVELGTPAVKVHLRKDMGGIMVLPVNWRSSLSFEEGGYKSETPAESSNNFTLKDITPDSLPSVRNVISDVMLDIPYYLSQHQPKMIAAVVNEANRVYDLWCDNNPGFNTHGRVHLIAHSLGSVMAIDILSQQQTTVPYQKAEQSNATKRKSFCFDVKNLYLCGSPAALFLLIKNQQLIPRRNRNKPSAEGEDRAPGVAGEQGTYGCLAVDNIYNVLNPYDPVAYRMNATVDAAYAASLRPAYIPSASTSWLSFGNPFKQDSSASKSSGASYRPDFTKRLPSSVELETHNFSREELAERRAYLLNDNGQVDYFLRYGGGPLEIQYLTMLGAHSSYWIAKDFIRFVVVETGREQGKHAVLHSAKAVKRKNLTTK